MRNVDSNPKVGQGAWLKILLAHEQKSLKTPANFPSAQYILI